MIIYMCKIFCVTNRKLCRDVFPDRIEKIAAQKPCGIVLREKDMDEISYGSLAKQVLTICERYSVTCILHSFYDAAIRLGCKKIHLPLHILRDIPAYKKDHFDVIGSSVHSVDEAREAEKLGCTYITAGHIFVTDCKKDLAPRGLDFLHQVAASVNIPVLGIGGITSDNLHQVMDIAYGACIMSGFMTCNDPEEYMKELRK